MDVFGFKGKTEYYRKAIKLTEISEEEFINIIKKENKL